MTKKQWAILITLLMAGISYLAFSFGKASVRTHEELKEIQTSSPLILTPTPTIIVE